MGQLRSLFERWPALAARLPVHDLGRWPTPVAPLALPGLPPGADVWIKRDDESSSIYGGNKVRKLELLLAADARPVLTIGAAGSHHVLATALHARALERDCIAVLVPQTPSLHAAEVRALNRRHCAALIRLDRPLRGPGRLWRAAPTTVRRLIASGGVCYIPPGGSNALGVIGYVAAGLELADQIAAGACPEPVAVYVPLGSGSTAAGLALGLALAGRSTEVIAVRVATRAVGHARYVELLARRGLARLQRAGLPVDPPPLRLRVEQRHAGPGYGRATRAARDAQARAAGCGITLETTYSAKALAAMIDAVERGGLRGPTMFLDTYGPIDHLKQPRASGKE